MHNTDLTRTTDPKYETDLTNKRYVDNEIKKVKATNIGTGGKEIIMVGDDSVATKNTKLLIEQDSLNSLGTEVVNSLTGNETTMAPSVQAVNNKFNEISTYSTEEQVIGTWLGKPIYRKIITYTQTSAIGILNDITHILIPHNIANFKQVIKIYGVSSIGNVLPILNGTNMSSQSASISSVDSNNINFRLINIQLSMRTWYFTLEYTKTTDSATNTINEEPINEEATI